jgi:hypothetical protein
MKAGIGKAFSEEYDVVQAYKPSQRDIFHPSISKNRSWAICSAGYVLRLIQEIKSLVCWLMGSTCSEEAPEDEKAFKDYECPSRHRGYMESSILNMIVNRTSFIFKQGYLEVAPPLLNVRGGI